MVAVYFIKKAPLRIIVAGLLYEILIYSPILSIVSSNYTVFLKLQILHTRWNGLKIYLPIVLSKEPNPATLFSTALSGQSPVHRPIFGLLLLKNQAGAHQVTFVFVGQSACSKRSVIPQELKSWLRLRINIWLSFVCLPKTE